MSPNVAAVGRPCGEVYRHSTEMGLDADLRFRVLNLEALIRAKRAAGRRKDLGQLPELEALLELKLRTPGGSSSA